MNTPTICRQVLIVVDKFCWFFFDQLQIGVFKNICSKNLMQRNCNKNIRSVNFPCESKFSMKKTYTKYELLQRCFSRILATDKETNIVQNICLTEQSFLNKITTGCLWNFFFLEVSMHLIAHFTCKDTSFERILGSRYGIFLNWTYRSHRIYKKSVFEILEELIRKHPQWNTASGNRV